MLHKECQSNFYMTIETQTVWIDVNSQCGLFLQHHLNYICLSSIQWKLTQFHAHLLHCTQPCSTWLWLTQMHYIVLSPNQKRLTQLKIPLTKSTQLNHLIIIIEILFNFNLTFTHGMTIHFILLGYFMCFLKCKQFMTFPSQVYQVQKEFSIRSIRGRIWEPTCICEIHQW
jgi:hypothetical protein